MKPEQIFEAVSYVDEDLLLSSENGESEKERRGRILHWRRWETLAACACLVLLLTTVAPLLLMRAGRSSSSSTSSCDNSDMYEGAALDETADGDYEAADEIQAGSGPENGTAAESAALSEPVQITCDGFTYEELTADGISDYGIEETEFENIPEEEIGDNVGIVESASDDSLIGAAVYKSKTHEELRIVDTENGWRYFCIAESQD